MTPDVIVVGAGPIGIEVAAALKRAGQDVLQFEAGSVGNTMTWWPRNTIFFSSPEWTAIAGIPIQTAGQEMITGETYLAYLRQVVEIVGLRIQTHQKVISVQGNGSEFQVITRGVSGEQAHSAVSIVLAIGDMHQPRMLGIPGEELPHVSHYFDDPHRFFQRRLLIVGGRNSALEAALRCWRAGVDVTLSYRRAALDRDRVISRIHLEISLLIKNGKLRFLPMTAPTAIEPGWVRLESLDPQNPGWVREPADFVFLATGHRPDNSLYRTAGVELTGESEQPKFDPETMETNVPGVYVAGTGTAGHQSKHRVFITTCHDHAAKIVSSICGGTAITGNYPARDYALNSKDIE